MAIGIIGFFASHRLKIPSPVITISGAIVMIPGVLAYQGFISIIEFSNSGNIETLSKAIQYSSKTAIIMLSIAIGITFPSLIIKKYEHRML
jgi:uncharacterized membrane protein YjjB (DUF3815 family)